MDKYTALLRQLRRYTGDSFTAKRGYDLRKPLNFGQRMAVKRYGEKLQELLSRPNVEYRPKHGEKTAAFEYTGQQSFKRFDTAFIPHYNKDANLVPHYDRKRPTGSRFYVVDQRLGIGQHYYHIPSYLFIDRDENEIADIIEEYAPDCEIFIIQAGESYVWGSSGSPTTVAKRIMILMDSYNADMFDANNKNSHYYGNWLHGVVALTHKQEAKRAIGNALARRAAFEERHHIRSEDRGTKIRRLKDGSFGRFEDGRYIGRQEVDEGAMEVRQLEDGRFAFFINGRFHSYVTSG